MVSTLSTETKVTYKTLLVIYNAVNVQGEEVKEVKVVNLCSCGSCCPVVKVADDHVEIGEEGNLCVLTLEEWGTLKSKILSKEI